MSDQASAFARGTVSQEVLGHFDRTTEIAATAMPAKRAAVERIGAADSGAAGDARMSMCRAIITSAPADSRLPEVALSPRGRMAHGAL
jgi:hypothetical protein